MATKTISIMDDVYELMYENKKEGESFSDLLRRTFKKKCDLMKHAGVWENMPEKEFRELERNIKMVRERSANNTLERISRW